MKQPSVRKLISWYNGNNRSLPWRESGDPFRVWVSEVMLQQTQVETVIPYYNRFLAKFGSVQALAQADRENILKLWAGLGYYSRAHNLHKAAQVVCNDLGGQIPNNFHDLKKLPGLGDYTAAAIASIAFDEPVPAVDGNVIRVMSRYYGLEGEYSRGQIGRLIFDRLLPVVALTRPMVFNQSLMEVGALICRPKKPSCGQCPLRNECLAIRQNLVERLPIRPKRQSIPLRRFHVGVIWDRTSVLIRRRLNQGMLAGLWEFPGGEIDENHKNDDTLRLTILKETGYRVKTKKSYCDIHHAYSHFRIVLTAIKCDIVRDRSKEKSVLGRNTNLKWVNFSSISHYPFDRATEKVINAVNKSNLRERNSDYHVQS